MNPALDTIQAQLDAQGCSPKATADGLTAKCPAHDDKNPSLSVDSGNDGRVLLHCHAGCPTEAVVAALGLTLRDLFDFADDLAHQGVPNGLVARERLSKRSSGRFGRLSPAGDQTHRDRRRVVRVYPRSNRNPPDTQLEPIAHKYRQAVRGDLLNRLANQLGLSRQSLLDLELGWDAEARAWAFPMRDGDDQLTGFRLRRWNGAKFTRKGTHEGLCLPRSLSTGTQLLVAEGPTDTAALLDLGFNAVGRPSCTGGVQQLSRLVRRLKSTELVIAADADGPGQLGASRLMERMVQDVPVRIFRPPAKDIREWLQRGGASTTEVLGLIAAAPVHRLSVIVKSRTTGGRQ